jgi:hypothetical protein
MRMLGRLQKGCSCPLCSRGRGWPATRIAKRAEQRQVAAETTIHGPEPVYPFTDLSDCCHGCNGDCENWGGPTCDFTCHDYRCLNCTVSVRAHGLWLGGESGGWFCSYECHAAWRES